MLNLAFIACVAVACVLLPVAVRLAFGPGTHRYTLRHVYYDPAQDIAAGIIESNPDIAAWVQRNRAERAFREAHPGARLCTKTGKWRDGRGRFIRAA